MSSLIINTLHIQYKSYVNVLRSLSDELHLKTILRMIIDELLLGIGNAAALLGGYCALDVLIREHLLQRHYTQTSNACASLFQRNEKRKKKEEKNPVTVLVLGYPNHGRSSFINTLFRVIYREDGALLLRSQTAPSPNTTNSKTVFAIDNAFLTHPQTLFNIIDIPSFFSMDFIDEVAVQKILRGKDPCKPKDDQPLGKNTVIPEAVILVAKASECCVGGPVWNTLPRLCRLIRDAGLDFVLVLTHKKEIEKEWMMEAWRVCRAVGERVESDQVYCLENYTVDGGAFGYGLSVKNAKRIAAVAEDFHSRCQTLGVVRDCVKMARKRRIQKERLPLANGSFPASSSSSEYYSAYESECSSVSSES